MTEFPNSIKFKFPWRSYQEKVLQEFEQHLIDKHLHVVAPPGSGKTVLGLEIARRLNKPTLILAPTLAIRNQWIQRFCTLFLETEQTPNWISTDIKAPKFLTVVTYQGLHAACAESNVITEISDTEESPITEIKATKNGLSNILEGLKHAKVATLVLDEAHHLQNQWWISLMEIKKGLDAFVVGLTATPPYDTSPLAYQKYLSLNGEIDTEITVPDLVAVGDLCPHQDYVFLSTPTQKEQETIAAIQQNAQNLYKQVLHDPVLIQAIQHLLNESKPEDLVDWVQKNFETFLSCLRFLAIHQTPISPQTVALLGLDKTSLSQIAEEDLQRIAELYLFNPPKTFDAFIEHQESLLNRLKRGGVIYHKTVKFSENPQIEQLLSNGLNKLDSITQIVHQEKSVLGDNLRMVILSDYIRKEFLVKAPENNLQLNKLGVIPIFEALRRANSAADFKMGVLTGSLVILPKSILPQLQSLFLTSKEIKTSPLLYDDRFVLLENTKGFSKTVVEMLTHLFEDGDMGILIGTKSLLGEGWDAPAINSLILASFVGAYVQSNQMRGRAIRCLPQNPQKTANIWHLISAQPSMAKGGADVQVLSRRFKHFMGVNEGDKPKIENGIGRLKLPTQFTAEEISAYNQQTFALSSQQNSLHQIWKSALKDGIHLIEELKVPKLHLPNFNIKKPFLFNKFSKVDLFTVNTAEQKVYTHKIFSIGSFLTSLAGLKGFMAAALPIAATLVPVSNLILAPILASGFIGLPTALTYHLLKPIPPENQPKLLKRLSNVVLDSLILQGIFIPQKEKWHIKVEEDGNGDVFCYITNGTALQKRLFLNCMTELLLPLQQQKYVVGYLSEITEEKSLNYFFVIPDLLSKNKEMADIFTEQWKKHIGNVNRYYTRNTAIKLLILRIQTAKANQYTQLSQVHKWA